MIQNTSVLAIGVKYLPSMPVSVRIGKNTMRMMRTAKAELFTTCDAPISTSFSISSLVSVLPASRLEKRCARMPSSMTIEPSTTMPKSIAPRLMRLAETPKIRIMMKPKSMARGMTEATIMPARTLPRKMMRTRKTISAPSIRLYMTVDIFRLTSSERLRYGSMLTPSGSIFCTFATRASSSLVTTLALAPLSIMAIPPTHSPSPSMVMAPKRFGEPKTTRPMSLMCTGMPPRLATTIFSISMI